MDNVTVPVSKNCFFTSHKIECVKCGKIDFLYNIVNEPEEVFQYRGWRATKNDNAVCPECARLSFDVDILKKEALWQCVITTQRIECTKCGKVKLLTNSDQEASKVFHEKGWRATNDHIVYCPECSSGETSINVFKKGNDTFGKIVYKCDKEEEIKKVIKNDLVKFAKNDKLNYLNHLSSLFFDVILNRVDEFESEDLEKLKKASKIILSFKNVL